MAMTEEYYPEAIKALMEYFRRLPGIGRRGAERLVSSILEWPPEEAEALGSSLCDLHSQIGRCPACGAWAEHGELCRICADPRRDRSLLCVVETMAQLAAVEAMDCSDRSITSLTGIGHFTLHQVSQFRQ